MLCFLCGCEGNWEDFSRLGSCLFGIRRFDDFWWGYDINGWFSSLWMDKNIGGMKMIKGLIVVLIMLMNEEGLVDYVGLEKLI